MDTSNLFLLRLIAGIGLIFIGLVSLAVIFGPKGLLIHLENPLFIPTAFAISLAIGLGAWLPFGYPLRKFLEPFLVLTLWGVPALWLMLFSPLPEDIRIILPSLSLILLVILYGNYAKKRAKDKKSI